MPDTQEATLTATNTVFDRLGKEVSEMLKTYLNQNYSIHLEPDSLFAIEEIGIALQRLVGETEARSIIQEIRQEIADLSAMQKLMTKGRNNKMAFWRVD